MKTEQQIRAAIKHFKDAGKEAILKQDEESLKLIFLHVAAFEWVLGENNLLDKVIERCDLVDERKKQ